MANLPENSLIAQRVQQFDAKHGDDGIAINGWLIFSDGAKREASNPEGSLVEPPKDKQEQDKIQLLYQEEMLRRATENVQRKKQAVVQQTRRKTPAELAQEFDTKHSETAPGIRDGDIIRYPNGAYRDGHSTMGALVEAEPDPWEPGKLERYIVRYWELSLKKAEDAFTRQRDEWLQSAKIAQSSRYVSAPPETASRAAAELKQLKKDVLAARKKLDKARKVQQKATAEFYWERQEPSEKQSKDNTDFIETVESIQI
jgi:hypothetical protein